MTPNQQLRQRGTAVAQRVNDAYMTDMYGREWFGIGRWLALQGFDDREIEAILRSKYMRWASDCAGGKCTLAGFKRFWLASPSLHNKLAMAELVEGTFAS